MPLILSDRKVPERRGVILCLLCAEKLRIACKMVTAADGSWRTAVVPKVVKVLLTCKTASKLTFATCTSGIDSHLNGKNDATKDCERSPRPAIGAVRTLFRKETLVPRHWSQWPFNDDSTDSGIECQRVCSLHCSRIYNNVNVFFCRHGSLARSWLLR